MLAARAGNPGLNLNGRKAPKGVGTPRTPPFAQPRRRRLLQAQVATAQVAQQWRQQRAQVAQAQVARQLRERKAQGEPTPRLVG